MRLPPRHGRVQASLGHTGRGVASCCRSPSQRQTGERRSRSIAATGMRPIVGHAAHRKAASGRKTGLKDAGWLCDLRRYGLVKPSLIQARAQRELRERTR